MSFKKAMRKIHHKIVNRRNLRSDELALLKKEVLALDFGQYVKEYDAWVDGHKDCEECRKFDNTRLKEDRQRWMNYIVSDYLSLICAHRMMDDDDFAGLLRQKIEALEEGRLPGVVH